MCKAAKIGRAIMDADVFISLTHFKGHEMTGFGGAIKNIGMGCGCRARARWSSTRRASPTVSREPCAAAGMCAEQLRPRRPSSYGERPARLPSTTTSAWAAAAASAPATSTPSVPDDDSANDDAQLQAWRSTPRRWWTGGPSFHISLVVDVSPYCDCHGENDAPILPGRGHVRLLRPGGAGPGLRGRLPGRCPHARQPAGRPHGRAGLLRSPRPLQQLHAGVRVAKPAWSTPRRSAWAAGSTSWSS